MDVGRIRIKVEDQIAHIVFAFGSAPKVTLQVGPCFGKFGRKIDFLLELSDLDDRDGSPPAYCMLKYRDARTCKLDSPICMTAGRYAAVESIVGISGDDVPPAVVYILKQGAHLY